MVVGLTVVVESGTVVETVVIVVLGAMVVSDCAQPDDKPSAIAVARMKDIRLNDFIKHHDSFLVSDSVDTLKQTKLKFSRTGFYKIFRT